MTHTFDEYAAWNQVMERLRVERPAPARAAALAAEALAAALTPKQNAALRAIDFAAEIPDLRAWFRAVLKTQPPGDEIDAFYFGLFTEAVGVLKKSEAPAMYVGGTDRFDPDDEDCEWACDMAYLPRLRYPKVRAFRELASALPPKGVLQSTVADAFVFALAEDLATHTEPTLSLGQRRWRAIASGYDSGDAYLIGYITHNGFVTQPPDA